MNSESQRSVIRGAYGEDQTRTELQRAQRAGLVWAWIDSVSLQRGDIDHIVVTRRGGVVALDWAFGNLVIPLTSGNPALRWRRAEVHQAAFAGREAPSG